MGSQKTRGKKDREEHQAIREKLKDEPSMSEAAKEIRQAMDDFDMSEIEEEGPEMVASFPLGIPGPIMKATNKALRILHGLSFDEVYVLINVKDNIMEIYKK